MSPQNKRLMTPSKLMSVYFFITRIKSITSNKMKERECKNFIINVFAFISSILLSKKKNRGDTQYKCSEKIIQCKYQKEKRQKINIQSDKNINYKYLSN